MKARLRKGIRLRQDVFGGVCYVPHRDDFFAADKRVFTFLQGIATDWKTVADHHQSTISALSHLGICETIEPAVAEGPYSGPSFLGQFVELPTVSLPLVVNCFCT